MPGKAKAWKINTEDTEEGLEGTEDLASAPRNGLRGILLGEILRCAQNDSLTAKGNSEWPD